MDEIVFFLLTGAVVAMVGIHYWMLWTADQMLDEDERNIWRNDWSSR